MMKCDICKSSLDAKTIGYVKTARGIKVYECRRCHAHRRSGKEKKLSGSWLLIA
jgi:Zn-finger protein